MLPKKVLFLYPVNSRIYTAIHPKFLIFRLIAGCTSRFMAHTDVQIFTNGVCIWCLCTLISTFERLEISFSCLQIDAIRLYHLSCTHELKGHQNKSNIIGNRKAKLQNMGKRRQIFQHTTKTLEKRRRKRHQSIVSLLTADDRDVNKLSSPTVRKSRSWVMAVQRKHCQILDFSAKIVRQHRHEKFPLEAISLSNLIIRLNTVENLRSYILTGHVEYESSREPTFALLAILVAIHFCVKSNKSTFSSGEDAVEFSLTSSLRSSYCLKPSLLPLAVTIYRTTRRHTQNFSDSVLGNSGNIDGRAPKRRNQLVQLLATEDMLSNFHDKSNTAW